MRSRGTRTLPGLARLPDHHRLAGLQRAVECSHQRAAIGHALDVGEDHLRLRIVDVVVEQFRHRDVRLAASRDHMAEADPGHRRLDHHAHAEAAALHRHRHPARLQLRRTREAAEGGHDIRMHVHQADAVRADQPYAAVACRGQHFLLQTLTLGPDLAEAATEHHRMPDALAPALGDHAGHVRGRQRDDRQVAGTIDRGDGRIRPATIDLAVLRVHRIHAAGIARGVQRTDGLAAEAGDVAAGTDDGDAAGGEKVGGE